MKSGPGQGESDRSHSQSRSSSSDKVNHRNNAHYRRIGVVSMPPTGGDQPEPELTTGAKIKSEVARRISLDDLSAAFQGKLVLQMIKFLNVWMFQG